MAKDALIVKTTPLPQSRISFELEIPSETCKTCVNETISSISRSAKTEIVSHFKMFFINRLTIFFTLSKK